MGKGPIESAPFLFNKRIQSRKNDLHRFWTNTHTC